LKEEQEWRTGRREAVEKMSNKVKFLSTAPVEEKAKFRGEEYQMNQSESDKLLNELRAIQRKIMQALVMKERVQARAKVDAVQHIEGGVNDAANNLTMITKDTIDEVNEMKYQLEKAQDEKVERERKLRMQASKIRELQNQLSTMERKKEALQRLEKKLSGGMASSNNEKL